MMQYHVIGSGPCQRSQLASAFERARIKIPKVIELSRCSFNHLKQILFIRILVTKYYNAMLLTSGIRLNPTLDKCVVATNAVRACHDMKPTFTCFSLRTHRRSRYMFSDFQQQRFQLMGAKSRTQPVQRFLPQAGTSASPECNAAVQWHAFRSSGTIGIIALVNWTWPSVSSIVMQA